MKTDPTSERLRVSGKLLPFCDGSYDVYEVMMHISLYSADKREFE